MSFLSVPSTSVPAAGYPPADPAISYSYPLDPFQQQAILAIHRGDDVLITAKTGSGKTLPAEYQIAYTLAKGGRVFYTGPVKALMNQKGADLRAQFGKENVGIMTGDIKSNPDAKIVVMTTEVLRNLLFKQATSTSLLGTAGQLSLASVGAVIFDEIHYFQDPERGHVWEECLILLPPTIRIVGLSATIDSPELFAGWIGAARQHPMVLLKTTHRVVPLVHGIFDPAVEGPVPIRVLKEGDEAPFQGGVYMGWLRDRADRFKAADKWKDRVRAAAATGDVVAGAEGKAKLKSFTHSLNECVTLLKTKDLLPALFFVFSRKECERYAEQIEGSLVDGSESSNIRGLIRHHLHHHYERIETLPQYHQITRLLERGIGFHHSGLLPLLKEIVEILFTRGFLKVLFCTETLGVGLNMPARTVVFMDLKKPMGGADGGFRALRPDEYIQMAGRAGRRGKDTRGYVFYLPAREPVDPEELRYSMSGGLAPLTSRLQFHYDFVLKALHASRRASSSSSSSSSSSKPLWNAVVDNSYWKVQKMRRLAAWEAELAEIVAKRALITVTPEQMEEAGKEAELDNVVRTTRNATQRRAREALTAWRASHVGVQWAHVVKQVEAAQKLDRTIADMRSGIAAAAKPEEEARIGAVLHALEEWGALVPLPATETVTETATEAAAATSDATPSEATATATATATVTATETPSELPLPTLTEFGICATEVNEGNPLLMARLYESKLLADASPKEIIGVLGAFVTEGGAIERSVYPDELKHHVSEKVKATLRTMGEWAEEGVAIDTACGVTSPPEFWTLATLWTDIGTSWITGSDAAQLTTYHEMFAGNLMRGLLKLSSLLNEWITLATYKADVDMLDKLKDTSAYLLRGIAQPESLYLRM